VTRIRDMEKLLESTGIHVKPWDPAPFNHYPPGYYVDNTGNLVPDPSAPKEKWTQVGCVWVRDYQPGASLARSFPRTFVDSRPADSHLGVSSDSAPLSSIKGTQLSILGTSIDITSFDAPDVDEPPRDAKATQPLYNKSLQAFLQSTMNVNPPLENIQLPPREEGFTYSEWYFLMIFPFLPVLHKPSYMKLVSSPLFLPFSLPAWPGRRREADSTGAVDSNI
jgi:hypothetical protein